jgi:hypothetical protein
MQEIQITIPKSSYFFKESMSSDYYYYSGSLTYFWIPMKPIKEGKLSLANYRPYTCREELIVRGLKERIKRSKNIDVLLGTSRVVTYQCLADQKRIKDIPIGAENAATLLNTIEREFKWKPTKPYRLIDKNINNDRTCLCYFEGDKRWFHSPHLASLWFLLIRAGLRATSPLSTKTIAKKKNTGEVLTYLSNLDWGNSDRSRIRAITKYVPLILKNYQKLFGCRSAKDLYNPKDTTHYNYTPWKQESSRTVGQLNTDGIQQLVKNVTPDNILYKKWKKILNDSNERKMFALPK